MSYLHEAALFLADGPHLHVEKPFTLAGFTEAVRDPWRPGQLCEPCG